MLDDETERDAERLPRQQHVLGALQRRKRHAVTHFVIEKATERATDRLTDQRCRDGRGDAAGART